MTNSEIKCEHKNIESLADDVVDWCENCGARRTHTMLGPTTWQLPTRTPEPIDSIEKLTKLVSSIALECKKLGLTQVETSNILKHTFSTTEPTKPSYSACPDCKFTGGHALVCKSEPTKAENGLVRLDDIKLWETINTTCSLRGITLSRGNISIIRDAILYTFGTPSITKDQLLAILPELTKEYFKKDITHADEMLADIQAMSMEIGHLRTKAIMKQRIEEMFNEKIN